LGKGDNEKLSSTAIKGEYWKSKKGLKMEGEERKKVTIGIKKCDGGLLKLGWCGVVFGSDDKTK
jgi:IS4 transposase